RLVILRETIERRVLRSREIMRTLANLNRTGSLIRSVPQLCPQRLSFRLASERHLRDPIQEARHSPSSPSRFLLPEFSQPEGWLACHKSPPRSQECAC